MNNENTLNLADLRTKKIGLENRLIEIHNRLLTENNLAEILRLTSQKRELNRRIKEIAYRITLITN
jgi:hypothetical protein